MSNSDSSTKTELLEIQEHSSSGKKSWKSVGSVQVVDSVEAGIPERKQLPRRVKKLLAPVWEARKQYYLFRHAPNEGPNTNLLVLLHGTGDTHVPFDKLAQQMALPQTATLAISALDFVSLPLGMGYTWIEDMDFSTGEPWPLDHSRRRKSLEAAARKLLKVLEVLIQEAFWIAPERVFFLGYGSGAATAMETCSRWARQGYAPFGGTVCVGGGTLSQDKPSSCKQTPMLIMTGEKDDTFPPSVARQVMESYPTVGNGDSKLYVQLGKGQGMIQSREEMEQVMMFLAPKLVRVSRFV